ncbi:MBL fold metallo-hydrolase [Raoultella sp. FYR_9]|uniref:MBL fold metallo-hydrolase n=1 Tax=Raoultella sp. FYR_9 TaxID=3367176 RepID=UPI00370B635A
MNESVVFGRGQGESVLVQLTEKQWMIVDSCTNDNKEPAALAYLQNLGLDPNEHVKIIVISHFHNDHIKGLSKIIEACPKADICISSALNTKEFEAYIKAISDPDAEFAQISEFNKIMRHFNDLKTQGRLKFAIADRFIFKNDNISVVSLSPCDNDITESNLNFANLIKVKNNTNSSEKSAAIINPNHYSVVLRIFDETSKHEMLLGSDLEVRTNGGWDAVCSCALSPKPNKVNVFKIPHHGSVTGYHEDTWNKLINNAPECLLTTYNSVLPAEDMMKKYGSKAKGLYCASTPSNYKKPDNLKNILRSLERSNSSAVFQRKNSRYGYITVKGYLSDSPVINIHGDAVKIA